jgi:GTP cyclohydrolase I
METTVTVRGGFSNVFVVIGLGVGFGLGLSLLASREQSKTRSESPIQSKIEHRHDVEEVPSLQTQESKEIVIARAYKTILEALGEDPTREGLLKTPLRAANALLFACQGYGIDPVAVVNNATFEEKNDNLVTVRNLDFASTCEHHLVPFLGKVHISYLPSGRVLGLSKFSRIVNIFARRLQVQEKLGREIADALESILKPRALAVQIESTHMCMVIRGVEQRGSTTLTTVWRGEFKFSHELKQQFLAGL